MKKICFAASSGGHFEEISRLNKVKENRDCFLFTEKGGFQGSNFCDRVYYVNQINRKEIFFLPKFLWLFVQSFRVLRAEKPDCVITTGALIVYPICLLAKLMKKKVIYIESFARVDSASLIGKLIYPIADLFIVQWEEALQFFPKAVYGGGIF